MLFGVLQQGGAVQTIALDARVLLGVGTGDLSHRQRIQAIRSRFPAGQDSHERTVSGGLSSEIWMVRHLLVSGAKAPLASALADRATVAA